MRSVPRLVLIALAWAILQPLRAGVPAIGRERQLFFDASLIESSERTLRRLNPAVKSEANPIIRRDRRWEGSDLRIAWVIFDERLQTFRMRYSTTTMAAEGRDRSGEVLVNEGQPVICEAFSADGEHWTKPELGLVEFEGSRANNIIPAEQHHAYFFQDLHDPDPSRRYKAHVRKGSTTAKGMTFELFTSPDAYRWERAAANPVVDLGEHVGRWGPTHFLGWDPIQQVYAVHMENNLHMNSTYARRSIGRAESPDLTHWSPAATIVVADARDYPDTEFYAMPTSFYAGWYLAFPWIFSTTNTRISPQFAFSRDGIHYDREFREAVISLGDNGGFDCVTVYAEAPIIHRGEIFCFYTGTNWRSPEQLEKLGDRARAAIGLAKLPLDGFVSLEGARRDYSIVTTRAFTFRGQELVLNLQAALQQWGAQPCEVRVEVLDERHSPIPGFAFAEADSLSRTGTDQRVSWRGNSSVQTLEGRPVRLRFHFKNAKLYSFQFR